MKQLDFPPSFLTGHSVIDDDHRRLISFLNRISGCFEKKQGSAAHEACTSLQRFMDEHMKREEKILSEAEFPQLGEHVETHTQLTRNCRHVLAGCDKACLGNRTDDCTAKLTAHIVEHIVGIDLAFKSFLQAEGIADPT